ncbi:MAG: GNAT family N-acetyltransferase [Alphaproteobacteria bacterium]
MGSLSIAPLSERPQFVEACAAWAYGEWGCHKKDSSLQKCMNRYIQAAKGDNTRLPQTWAGTIGEKMAGMISLTPEDHPERIDLTPWIASFFIHPEFRGKGFSYAFLDAAERGGTTMGYKTLYLYTPTAQDLYKKAGWETFEQRFDPTGLHPHVYLMKKTP